MMTDNETIKVDMIRMMLRSVRKLFTNNIVLN